LVKNRTFSQQIFPFHKFNFDLSRKSSGITCKWASSSFGANGNAKHVITTSMRSVWLRDWPRW